MRYFILQFDLYRYNNFIFVVHFSKGFTKVYDKSCKIDKSVKKSKCSIGNDAILIFPS